MTRLRRIVQWLLGAGLASSVAVSLLVARGVDETTARAAVRDVVQADRAAYTDRVLVVVPEAQAVAASADAAALLCGPDVDGGDTAHADCLAANADTFLERYCRASNDQPVARGAEILLRADEWRRLRDGRDQGINYTVVRPAPSPAGKLAELTARGWKRCDPGAIP